MNLKKIIIFFACIFLLAGCGDKTPAGTEGTVTDDSKETADVLVSTESSVSISEPAPESEPESGVVGMNDLASITIFGIPVTELENDEFLAALWNVTGQIEGTDKMNDDVSSYCSRYYEYSGEVNGYEVSCMDQILNDGSKLDLIYQKEVTLESGEWDKYGFEFSQEIHFNMTDGTCYISLNTCYPNADGLVIPQKYLDLANTEIETEDGVSFEVYAQNVDWYASGVFYMINISFEKTREWTPEEVKNPVVEEPVVEEPIEPQEEYLEITGDAKKAFDKLVGTWYSPEDNFSQMGHSAFYMTINSDGTYCYGEPGENNTIKTVYRTGTFKYKGYNGKGYTFVDPEYPESCSMYVPADENRFSFNSAMFEEKLK